MGPGRLARPAQRRLAEMVDEALPPDARVVIDVGCGPGWLAIELARRRPELRVVAVDLSRTMAKIARRHASATANVEVLCENGARLSSPDGAADMIVSAESMHHWRHPVAVLDEFHRVLRPGCRAWIFDGRDDFEPSDMAGWTFMSHRSPPRPVVALLRAILRAHGFSAAQWGTHVPDLVKRSRFGVGKIGPCGIYGRLELVRPA
jgi:ubiquinone/menaquinone biosynthesis C-methylase UbiE